MDGAAGQNSTVGLAITNAALYPWATAAYSLMSSIGRKGAHNAIGFVSLQASLDEVFECAQSISSQEMLGDENYGRIQYK